MRRDVEEMLKTDGEFLMRCTEENVMQLLLHSLERIRILQKDGPIYICTYVFTLVRINRVKVT